MTAGQIACAVVILAGVAVALAPRENLHIKSPDLFKGIGWGLIAAVGQGFGAGVLSRYIYKLAKEMDTLPLDGFHAGITVAVQRMLGGMVFSGLCLLAFRAWLRRRPDSSSLGNLTRRDNQWRPALPWLLAKFQTYNSTTTSAASAVRGASISWQVPETPTFNTYIFFKK